MNCLIQALKYDDIGRSIGVRWVFCDQLDATTGWNKYPIRTSDICVCEGTFEEFCLWVRKCNTLHLHLRDSKMDMHWLDFLRTYKWFSQILADGRIVYNQADNLASYQGVDYFLDYSGIVHTSWAEIDKSERGKVKMLSIKDRITEKGRKYLRDRDANLTLLGWVRRVYNSGLSCWTPPNQNIIAVPECVDALMIDNTVHNVTQVACGEYMDGIYVHENSDIRALKSPNSCTMFSVRGVSSLEYLVLPSAVYLGTLDRVSSFELQLDKAPQNLEVIDQSSYGIVSRNFLHIRGVNNIHKLILRVPVSVHMNVKNMESIDLWSIDSKLGWSGANSHLELYDIPKILRINVIGKCNKLFIKCSPTGSCYTYIQVTVDGWLDWMQVEAKENVTFRCAAERIGTIVNSGKCTVNTLSGHSLSWTYEANSGRSNVYYNPNKQDVVGEI